MKELSIEEKAKRYDEAIKNAKSKIKNDKDHVLYEDDVIEIFPELVANENERIRTFLHHTFTAQYLCKDKLGKWHGEPVVNILGWLEKQGEQKPTSVLDIEIPFGAKDSELQEATYYIPKDFHAEIDDDKVVIKKGKKQTSWSEEDEAMINSIIRELIHQYNEEIPQGTEDKIKWLKNKLKFIKPQSQWKPSEEMLEALYKVIPQNVMEISEDEMLLDKLYQGLKYGRVLSKKELF